MATAFVSYARNREDVVLWRSLGHVDDGRYIELGARGARQGSPTFALHERGWAGVCVATSTEHADQLVRTRPGDTIAEAAATGDMVRVVHSGVREGSRLPTGKSLSLGRLLGEVARYDSAVHVMTIRTGEAAPLDLDSLDLSVIRPWVILVTAEAEDTSRRTGNEAASPGPEYELRLFDGVSQYYVASERSAAMGELLTYPACARDNYVTSMEQALRERIAALERCAVEQQEAREELTRQLVRWRGEVLERWVDACASSAARGGADLEAAHRELDSMRSSLSWRVTGPLRSIRRMMRPGG